VCEANRAIRVSFQKIRAAGAVGIAPRLGVSGKGRKVYSRPEEYCGSLDRGE
jgi:hypothetical protein